MRPLGGIVFGRIADKRGRKFVLVTTMLMMATGSLLIGVMPTYAAIGAWASADPAAARVMQGFAHGGESATAYSYVGEIAPPNRRGMWGSVAFIAIFGGSVLAYTVGGVVTASLSESAVGQWGWRIPFLLGALLALFALYLRRSMDESDVFDAAQKRRRSAEHSPPHRRPGDPPDDRDDLGHHGRALHVDVVHLHVRDHAAGHESRHRVLDAGDRSADRFGLAAVPRACSPTRSAAGPCWAPSRCLMFVLQIAADDADHVRRVDAAGRHHRGAAGRRGPGVDSVLARCRRASRRDCAPRRSGSRTRSRSRCSVAPPRT